MKIREIRELSTEEIIKQIEAEEESIVDARFAHALRQLDRTSKFRETRRTIARLHTVVRERELAEQEEVLLNKKKDA